MAADFAFQETLSVFKDNITQDIDEEQSESIQSFTAAYKAAVGNDADKRTAADQALRNLISSLINETTQNTRSDLEIANDAMKVITVSVMAAKQGISSASLPFILLGDMLDCLTLDTCDPVFCYIEERVGIWKSQQFYTAGKNYLLRMCNDLLRRLSQAQNTVFCGRIQLFLARLFPLSEKSALNLVSQFNSDNITIFNKNPEKSILKNEPATEEKTKVHADKSMEVEVKAQKDEIWLDGNLDGMEVDQPEGSGTGPTPDATKPEEKGLIIDYDLYSSIWSLQDIFRYPLQSYTKEVWEKFTKNAETVFRVFSSYKLDKQHFSEGNENKAYFAKFLTSEKLTNLQLNDCMFRRQILCQFLILFQYLVGTVKFKSSNAVLSEKQSEWITATRQKIFTLLEETPPDGKVFALYIKHLLAREEFWISWKNEGCTSFIKKKPEEKEPEKASVSPPLKRRKTDQVQNRPKKSRIAEDFIAGKKLGMGSPELTRLWELCPDNLAACKSEKRSFLPTLETFFADAIELMDPKSMVEEQYMPYNEPNFQWKALRLLSQRSPLFFASQPAPMQFKVVPQYLKGVIEKLSKEFPQSAPEQPEVIQENGEIEKSMEEDETAVREEGEKTVEKEDREENEAGENEIEEDDDEVLEDDDFENDDALLNDDSQNDGEDVDSEDDGVLENVSTGDILSSDDVTMVAQKIGKDWEKLAPFLDLKPKDVAEIKEDSEDVILQARQTLVTWQDRNRSEARRPTLVQALEKAGMDTDVF